MASSSVPDIEMDLSGISNYVMDMRINHKFFSTYANYAEQ